MSLQHIWVVLSMTSGPQQISSAVPTPSSRLTTTPSQHMWVVSRYSWLSGPQYDGSVNDI